MFILETKINVESATISLTDISGSALGIIYLGWDSDNSNIGEVWIDIYAPNSASSTHGWVSIEEAETIATSILLAVKYAKEGLENK